MQIFLLNIALISKDIKLYLLCIPIVTIFVLNKYYIMDGIVVAQKLKYKYSKSINKAIAYYSILFTLNNVELTKKEIELLAFIAVRGTITPPSAREEFIEQFKSSKASVENLKGKLKKKGILICQNKMYKVHPKIAVDFDKKIIIKLELS